MFIINKMSVASSKMVKAHGGPPMAITQKKEGISTGAFVMDTMANAPRPVHMASMDVLVAKTTGTTQGPSVMSGVIVDTKASIGGLAHDVPETRKMPKGERGKTQAKSQGQIPYAGPKY